jgi:hypothetical protein
MKAAITYPRTKTGESCQRRQLEEQHSIWKGVFLCEVEGEQIATETLVMLAREFQVISLT